MSTAPARSSTSREPVGALVHLDACGVCVLLDVSGTSLPAVGHWGPSMGALDHAGARSVIEAQKPVTAPNAGDVPARLSLLPEPYEGWSGRPGLSGSRRGSGWSPRFRTTSVRLDGDPVTGFVAGGPGAVEVAAEDEEAMLGLALTVQLLPSGLLRSRAVVTNRAPEDYTVDDLCLAYPVPAEAAELLDLAGRWGHERVPQRRSFGVGTHLREGRRGRTGADSALVLHAGTPGFGFGDGQVWAVHTAYSGNHTHYAERLATGERVLGGGELLLPGEVRLAEGESYESPWVYGSFGTGLDAVAARFHRHLRSRTRPVSTDRPVTLNVWEAVYFDHDVERLTDLARRAAALGVERFVLDDGWFGSRRDDRSGLGDWVVSPDVWPNGLHPLVDEVTGLGMQFGLWFEPEMVNPDSDVARAHPEWVMAARAEWPPLSRSQQVLNIGIPEAYEHVRGQLGAILDEYEIGYVKWDHNRDLVEAGATPDGGRPGVHRQTRAFYRLLDDLRAAYPALEIESCSSGGARVDLGVLERTDRVWVSDCIDPLERQQMLRWTAQLVPPEMMGSHIASGRSHTTGRVHDLGFRAATAVFGHLGVEWDLAAASAQELEELGAWIGFFKANRGLLLGGDLVRMDGFDDAVLVHGVVSTDRAEAIFAMAVVGSPDAVPGPRLRLRGLAPERTYLLEPVLVGSPPPGLRPPPWWSGGATLTGAALAHVGVAPPAVHPEQVVLLRATARD